MIRPPRFVPDHIDAGLCRIRQQASKLPHQPAPGTDKTSKADETRTRRIHTLLAALTPAAATAHAPAHDPHPFGEPYQLGDLPLPRPAIGYGIHLLGTDRLLDQHSQRLQAMRHPSLHAVFDSFAAAETAALDWLGNGQTNTATINPTPDTLPLSIVPLGWDANMQRPILLWGMLSPEPEAELDAARATLRQILEAQLAN
jgi:hypothetical protein